MNEIFSIIEQELMRHGFKILDGDNDTCYMRKNGTDYKIKIEQLDD